MLGCFLGFLLISSMVYHTSMYFMRCPLDRFTERFHMYWDHVEGHTCTTYATREYTAQLMNLPTCWGYRTDMCLATPLEIHGISYLPKVCEDWVSDVSQRCRQG